MNSRLDFRNPNLWTDMTSTDMWRAFKIDLDQRIGRTFAPERSNPIVDIRDSLVVPADRFDRML